MCANQVARINEPDCELSAEFDTGSFAVGKLEANSREQIGGKWWGNTISRCVNPVINLL